MMDEQKAFIRSYQHKVESTAGYLLGIVLDKANLENYEPELFVEDVIRKMNAIFKKEDRSCL